MGISWRGFITLPPLHLPGHFIVLRHRVAWHYVVPGVLQANGSICWTRNCPHLMELSHPNPTLSVRKNLRSETSFSQAPWWNFFYLCWMRKTEFTVEPNFNLSVDLSAGGTLWNSRTPPGPSGCTEAWLRASAHVHAHDKSQTTAHLHVNTFTGANHERTMRSWGGTGTRCWVVFWTSL